MIDPESWLRVVQQDRERDIQALHRTVQRRTPMAVLSGAAAACTPRAGLIRRTAGRTVGRGLVRVGLWLMVPPREPLYPRSK